RYFRERHPYLHLAVVWKLFRDLVGEGRVRIPRLWRKNERLTAPNANESESPSENSLDAVNAELANHFFWSDKCADVYGDRYRSAYVSTYLLSAIAVFMALLPMAAGLTGIGQLASVIIEFGILVVIVLLLGFGRRRQWHQRWMEYRLL